MAADKPLRNPETMLHHKQKACPNLSLDRLPYCIMPPAYVCSGISFIR